MRKTKKTNRKTNRTNHRFQIANIFFAFFRWQIFYLPKRVGNATEDTSKYKGLTSEELNATNTGVEVHVEDQGKVLVLTLTGTLAHVCFERKFSNVLEFNAPKFVRRK